MRSIPLVLSLLLCLPSLAGTFTIQVEAPQHRGEVVSLFRYDDLFTLRTRLLVRGLLNNEGTTTLQGEVVEGTTHRVQLRIGDVVSDLYLRAGHALHVRVLPTSAARSLNGTTRADLEFLDLGPLDVNALAADLNGRVDDFISEDLATDRVAGMQAVEVTRKEGGNAADSTKRPPTLFVTPLLSAQRVDTFEHKLDRFYAGVDDAWFIAYRRYTMAGLRQGPRTIDKDLYARYLSDGTVYYDNPEQVRFLRGFFADLLPGQVVRDAGDTLRTRLREGDVAGLVELVQRNDFLRHHQQLSELVLMDQLYLMHPGKLLERAHVRRTLQQIAETSTYAEHRAIATNMLWDLTAMSVGQPLPSVRLLDDRDRPVALDSLLQGPVCVVVTAAWCTYCAVELEALERLHTEYKGSIRIIAIALDTSITAVRAYRKAHPGQDFAWYRAMADQELREQLRLRAIPAVFLLNDGILARSPAPLPSEGLGALFHQARTAVEQDQRIKVWEEPDGIKGERPTSPTPR